MKNLFISAGICFIFLVNACQKPHYAVSGVVVNDATGAPVVNAEVKLYYNHCDDCEQLKGSMITKSDGQFAFTVKEPVFYTIEVYHHADSTQGLYEFSGEYDHKTIVIRLK